jgi:hypothetical protein
MAAIEDTLVLNGLMKVLEKRKAKVEGVLAGADARRRQPCRAASVLRARLGVEVAIADMSRRPPGGKLCCIGPAKESSRHPTVSDGRPSARRKLCLNLLTAGLMLG